MFFRIWKSGCRVEALQLGTLERLERALVIYLIIAWRILYLVTEGRDCPNLPCDVVFRSRGMAGRLDRRPPRQTPAIPPPLGQMARLIAGFGGFLGRKRDGHPGPRPSGRNEKKSERLPSASPPPNRRSFRQADFCNGMVRPAPRTALMACHRLKWMTMPLKSGADTTKLSVIGIDVGKNVFACAWRPDAQGKSVLRKTFGRGRWWNGWPNKPRA